MPKMVIKVVEQKLSSSWWSGSRFISNWSKGQLGFGLQTKVCRRLRPEEWNTAVII